MRFQTVNDLNLFRFDESTIKELRFHNDKLEMVLEALIAKGNNPCNEECVDRFVDIASLRFVDAKVVSMVKEGFKYYDADGNLKDQVEDAVISPLEYESIFKSCKDVILYDLILSKMAPGEFEYQIGIDLNDEDTYWITVACKETVTEWDRFMNRVM